MGLKPNIRELVLKKGFDYPSDKELIMLLLGSGTRGIPVDELSEKIASMLNTINYPDLVPELLKIKGVGTGRALALAAAIELGRRKTRHLKAVIKQPSDIIPFIKHYALEQKEHFLCITLNGAHEIIKIHVTSVGTLNKTLIHPREIFSSAIVENAAAIILSHNHPSGNPEPSAEDIESTKALLEGTKLLGITLLDHIILGGDLYYSFAEHKLLIK
ncbi:DNA repair protein RadC [Treponema parvum]|uniref:DNA repair protein RadC n=1 Tax=Treponema parvum TaxID=138851 RepID=A0A975EYG0_9SPIR|nr:DNA repair protein RadC [Treponema parvum]QTQ11255.1 DNA repair protein RadC [Treponema parvum]QTQ16811.1 DNA repair protein RadC [Treponema parvum]